MFNLQIPLNKLRSGTVIKIDQAYLIKYNFFLTESIFAKKKSNASRISSNISIHIHETAYYTENRILKYKIKQF